MPNEKKEIRKGPKTVGTVILATVIVVGLIAGSVWGIDAIKYVSTDDAAIDGRQVKLSSKILGRIGSISTNEGDKVNENDVLVTLDETDLKAQEKQASAALASARRNLALTKINRDKTKNDSDRVAKLYANAATTRESYDHAVNAIDAAEAQLSLAQAQVDTAAAQLGVIAAQIMNATVRTPISGTVNKITLREGDLAQPGQTILDVNNLDDIWVTANLEETKIGKIKIGVFALGVNPYGLINKLTFGDTEYRDPVTTAAEMTYKLKKEEKCSMVVCLSHMGYKADGEGIADYELAKQSKNIDVILGGHSHTLLSKPVSVYNSDNVQVFITQNAYAGVRMSRIDCFFSATGDLVFVDAYTNKVFKNQV